MKRRNMPRARHRRQLSAAEREVKFNQALHNGHPAEWRRVGNKRLSRDAIETRLAAAQERLNVLKAEQP